MNRISSAVPSAAPPWAQPRRRRQVLRALADHDLLARPRRLAPAAGGEGAARLGLVLAGLGPPYDLFARYLATRPDRLPGAACLALAAVPVSRTPGSSAPIRRSAALEGALAGPLAHRLDGREPRPLRPLAGIERYRCRLRDGRAAELRLVPPGLRHAVARDLPRLAVLDRVRAFDRPGGRPPIDRTLRHDFARWVGERLDLRRQARALARLAPPPGSALRPAPIAAPSGRDVLVLIRDPAARAGSPAHLDDEGRRVLARDWLQLVLTGRAFPVDADLAVEDAAHGEPAIAVLGGTVAEIADRDLRQRLWRYLDAVRDHDLAAAGDFLAGELVDERGAALESFRLQLRQLVPFRDGGWTGAGDSLAEYLVLHGRLAFGHGLRPSPALAAVYRGAFAVATAGRAPYDGDPLGAACRDLGWQAGRDQLRRAVSSARFGAGLERAMSALIDLPPDLDRLLEELERRLPSAHGGQEEAGPGRTAGSGVPYLALALAAAMTALARFASPAAAPLLAWPFGLFAVLLLWALWRWR